ncbi:MAG: aromatic acid exporter family protein [Bacillota bacterium]|nr:aromatic acid exporter family protein [Bacillota bacterium]
MTTDVSTFFRKFFGLRTLKTALATALALYIAMAFDLRMPVMAGLAAIVTIQSSITNSFRASIDRLISTLVGLLIGSFFNFINFLGFFPLILAIVLVINICNYFKWKDSISLAVMISMMIMVYTPTAPDFMPYWLYGIHRFFDTFVGLLIGFLVNYFILRPDPAEFILKTYQRSLQVCESALKNILAGQTIAIDRFMEEVQLLNEDLNNLRKDGKYGSKYYFKLHRLAKINSSFFTAFAFLAQLSEEGPLPSLSDQNKDRIDSYFAKDLVIKSQGSSQTYTDNYNYYLADLLQLMEDLKEAVKDLEKSIKAKEKSA